MTAMTTHSPEVTVVTSHMRGLRVAPPWPFQGDAPGVIAGFGGMATFIYGWALIVHHANIYMADGVAHPEAGSGALVSQVLILLALLGTGLLYRRGYPMRWVYAGLCVAAALAVGFALLPHLVAGHPWLDTLLGFIVAIVFNLFLTAYVALATAFAPLWWEHSSR
jgi:hypothetical protein